MVVVAGLQAVALVATSTRYGYHGDEFYFIVAGSHPALGYPDQPPLVPLLSWLMHDLAPGSLMIEITGVQSKVEGLIQVLTDSEDRILEISRTGRMVMRRGQHTSRVLEAMGAQSLDGAGEFVAGTKPLPDFMPDKDDLAS